MDVDYGNCEMLLVRFSHVRLFLYIHVVMATYLLRNAVPQRASLFMFIKLTTSRLPVVLVGQLVKITSGERLTIKESWQTK